MPHPEWDNVHLRDTVVQIREGYGVSALGPVQILPGGAILPTDISNLYPGVDLTPAVEATGCFNARWGDCKGAVANCPTLQSVVLCEHHHREAHARDYPADKGNFQCLPPA